MLLYAKKAAVDRISRTRPSIVVTKNDCRKAGAASRIGNEEIHLSGEFLGVPNVVRVLKCDIVAPGLPKSKVAVVESAIHGIPDDPKAWIVELREADGRVVAGRIIDAENFDVAKGLIEHRLQSLPYESSMVVGGKNNGD
jgi:hypothetical protein